MMYCNTGNTIVTEILLAAQPSDMAGKHLGASSRAGWGCCSSLPLPTLALCTVRGATEHVGWVSGTASATQLNHLNKTKLISR
ncbi:hypothetical protein E2C01_077274 [Portunus trituberculatus]|uniref:Uncharacterized protein n=1 Tax=Portunus trituberculatus TaxID=210409 RepID=A0A5B7IKZ5_PORTR|nr:hypothetical protein [Portunus trituberculatus]